MLAPFQFQFTFHCGGELRKGLPVHAGIVDGLVGWPERQARGQGFVCRHYPEQAWWQSETGGVHFFLCAIIIVSLCALKLIARLLAVCTIWLYYHVTCGFKLRPVARYVEFGRALVDKMLADGSTSYRYFGFLNDTQFADLSKHVMSKVYQSWDDAASSPSKDTIPR